MVSTGAEPDGTPVQLDVSVFTPDTAGRHPAIVLSHGFGGTKADSASSARLFAADGYVVVTYTARGFGASGGRIHLDAPAYEVADASKLIDMLATRTDVQLDAPGDPHVGVAGASYGGALALLAAGYDRRVDAVVATITWNDLTQALFPQSALAAGAQPATPAGAVPASQPGVFKQRWALLLFGDGAGASPSAGGNASATGCGRFDPTVCADYQRAAITGTADARLRALLKASSPSTVAAKITAPTLLLQGEQDALFGLDQSDATAREISAAGSTAVRVAWFAGGHDAASVGLGGAETALTNSGEVWFDQYLKGKSEDNAGFRYSIATSGLGLGVSDMTTKQLPAYPGIGGVAPIARTVIPLRNRPQQVISPPGGSPAALTGMPGSAGALAALGAAGGSGPLGILQGQSATFPSAPLDGGTSIVGSSRVRLQVTSSTTDAVLFASLWVVKGSGRAAPTTVPDQLVAPIRLSGLTPGTPVTVDVALPAVVAHVDSGSRVRVVVSSTDQAYATPTDARVYQVSLDSVDLSVPIVTGAATVTNQAGTPWGLIGFVLLTIAGAAATALIVRHRARHELAAAGALVTAAPGFAGFTRCARRRTRPRGDGRSRRRHRPCCERIGEDLRPRRQGCRRRFLDGATRAGRRPARTQRRRQDHDHAHDRRPGQARRRIGRGARTGHHAGLAGSARRRRLRRGAGIPAPLERTAEPRRGLGGDRSPIGRGAPGRGARDRRAGVGGRPQGAHLQPRDEGPSRHRRRDGRPARRADPGRTHQRARPATDRGHALGAARLRRDRPHRHRVEPPAGRGGGDLHARHRDGPRCPRRRRLRWRRCSTRAPRSSSPSTVPRTAARH